MKIRTAYEPPQTTSVFSILTLIVFVFSTIGLFKTVENPLFGISLGVIGVIALIFAMKKDHQRQDGVSSGYSSILNRNFHCPDCSRELPKEIEHEDTDGMPILHLCESCDVLWYTGDYTRST